VVGVGQEFEVQALFGAEFFVRVDAVEAYAEDDRVVVRVFRLVDLEVVGFAGAAGGLILGIEIQDDPLAAIIVQANRRAFLRGQGEVGRGASLRGQPNVRAGAGRERPAPRSLPTATRSLA
jgi:hypothetical protein